MVNTRNAWIVIEPQPSVETPSFPGWVSALSGSPNLLSAIAKNDWVLVVTPTGDLVRTGRVFRLLADTNGTTVYFDRLLTVDEPVSIKTAGLSLPEKRSVGRLQWDAFTEALPKLAAKTVDDIPPIDDQAYIRELLQLAVMDDLLGPAHGPHEQIVDMSMRDRYLVGKAPRPWIRTAAASRGWKVRWPPKPRTSIRATSTCTRVGTSRARSLTARPAVWMRKPRRSTRSTRRATSRSSRRVSG